MSVHTSPLAQPGTGDSGGMNVYVARLAEGLVARGVAVDVYTRSTGGDLPPTVALAPGLAVHHLDAGPPQLRKDDLASHLCAFYLALAAHPSTAHLDLLHGHYWMSGWVGRQASKRLGLPLVQTFHTLARAKNAALAPGDAPEPPLRLVAEEHVVAAADAVVAPTPAEADLLQHGYGARPSQVHVVPPGVDLATFSPDIDRHAARQALGGGRIVLFVGRLQPLKGPDMAVRTLAALTELLPDDGIPTRLVIVGGASGSGDVSPPALRRLADALGVGDRVAFLAPRPHPELATLYRAADAVLMPSRSESFGLVALEAQACGTPVVASDIGGLRHVVGARRIECGHAGLRPTGLGLEGVPGGGTLVAEHQPSAYAAALVPYLVDARARAAAGRAGRRRAERHDWGRTTGSVLGVYASVLATPAAADLARGA